ncbi:MAG: RNA-directed DNA polymerase [Bdellovibrionia bacterium]
MSGGGRKIVWALQMDVEKFFVNINRPILCSFLLGHTKHPKLRELISCISHDARIEAKQNYRSNAHLIASGKSWFDQGPDQRIPIGNLSSQFAANVVLTGLDHFILRELKPEVYLRYMDDALLMCDDPKKLRSLIEPNCKWLEKNRCQRMNTAKTKLVPLTNEIIYINF